MFCRLLAAEIVGAVY